VSETGLAKKALVLSSKYLALNPAISSTADIHDNYIKKLLPTQRLKKRQLSRILHIHVTFMDK
jgi:hypothetical protein